MIKLIIDHWKLIAMAKEAPANYEILRQFRSNLVPLEEAAAGKGYQSFEAYINDPAELPEFIFAAATWEPIRPLKLMTGDRINTKDVAEALSTSQVHLPGNELLRIREVQVQEDCCTDVIQKLLTEGWKIIAVCPQPSRRPDYILGRGIE